MKQFPISNRKIPTILAVVALLAVGIPLLISISQQSQETRGHTAASSKRISFAGSKWFLVGYDYPWNNYGYEFSNSGSNVHGQYSTVNDTFADLQANGTHVTRWFVFTDFRAAPLVNNNTGMVTGLPANFFQSFDDALAIAHTHNIYLIPDMLDGITLLGKDSTNVSARSKIFTDPTVRQSFFDNAVKPVLQRYGNNPNILAWSPINEPDYETQGVDPGNFYTIPYTNMQDFMRQFTQYVHTYTSQMATIENASQHLTHFWTGLGFDFYSPHFYDWMAQYWSDSDPVTTPASSLNLDKPVVIGEAPSTGSRYSVQQYLDATYTNGYAGVLFWSANGGDSASNYNGTKSMLKTWAQAHARDVNITTVNFNVKSAHAWYNSSYLYRKQITIDHTKVKGSSDLTDFPVLISEASDADLKTQANGGKVHDSNGYDIIFVAGDDTTKLDHEIEKYVATTGEIEMWVRIPTLTHTVDTVIYMYYGNNLITSSQENRTGTWNRNYAGIWHLKETSGTQYDSTSNGNNSSTVSVTMQGSATGQIDGADQFNGSSDYVQVNGLMGSPSSVTLSAWANLNSGAGYGEVISLGNHVVLRVDDGSNGAEGIYNDGSTWQTTASNTSYAGTGFHYFTFVVDSVNHTQTIYVDGIQKAQTNYTGAISYSGLGSNTLFGRNGEANSFYFNGVIDEPRVSSSARSANWIATEYNNQNSPSTFYTVASQEQTSITYITAVGSNFYLNGHPIKLIGFNTGFMTTHSFGCGQVYSDADIDTAFSQLHAHGASVVRIWPFQPYTNSGTYLDRVNYLLTEAQKYNIYLVFDLDSQWSYCTSGGDKPVSWYQSGYLSPYGTNPLSYKDYVGLLVSLYKNRPNILMWELVGEPQTKNDDGSCNFDALYNFASEMSDYVKSIDPNHLIGLGAEDITCVTGANYIKMHSLPHLDVLEDDDYGNPTVPFPGSSLAQSAISVRMWAQDQNWGWIRLSDFQNTTIGDWTTVTGTLPQSAVAPLRNIGITFYNYPGWKGRVYLDNLKIGGTTYSFEDGTTQGWTAESKIFSSGTSAIGPALDGAHSFAATFNGTSGGASVMLSHPPGKPGDQVIMHIYTPANVPAGRTVAADLQVAKVLNKPYMVVESGIYSHCNGADCYTENQRADYFNAKMKAFFSNGGSVYLIWSYVYNHTPTDMDVDYLDPLNNTLLSIASSLNAGAGPEAPENLLLLLPVFLAFPKAKLQYPPLSRQWGI